MKPKTWAHPKFTLLQRKLQISPALAAGILEGIWHLTATFDDETGEMPYSGEELASWLGIDIDGELLIETLIAGKWLDQKDGQIFVHGWQEHMPKYVSDRIRIRKQREARSEQSRTVADSSEQSPPSASASASVRKKKNTSPPTGGYPPLFVLFWEAYPKSGRVRKKAAATAWKSATKRADPQAIISAATEYATCGQVRAGYCRHATTWLNGDSWDDDRNAWAGNGKPPEPEYNTDKWRTPENEPH